MARIENATFAQIAPLLPPTIEQQPLATNLDALSGNVEASLRALPDVHVTTYAYEPLVGITRITDPREGTPATNTTLTADLSASATTRESRRTNICITS